MILIFALRNNELPVIKICYDEGRDDCQQLKPKGTQASFGTTFKLITVTVFIIPILFRRVTVNVLVFVLRVVSFHPIVYIVTRYMYDAVRRNFALSVSFVVECFDGSEVTTREGNELVVQKENCVVEEIKEVELRSRLGKFIYKRTYNSVGLSKVSHFFRRDRAPSRLPIKVTKITSVDDMTQIMIVGIQLYSGLSLLGRQSMLMLTELPGMVALCEQFFRLEHSDSYTGNIHGDPRIEGYHYCMCHSQGRAHETLLALNHNSFIL